MNRKNFQHSVFVNLGCSRNGCHSFGIYDWSKWLCSGRVSTNFLPSPSVPIRHVCTFFVCYLPTYIKKTPPPCFKHSQRVLKVKQTNADEMVDLDDFHKLIQEPVVTACLDLKPLGGTYWTKCKLHNGHKFTCMDDIPSDIAKDECLIYSFGINDDWSYESLMGNLGRKTTVFLMNLSLTSALFKVARF